MKSLHIYIYFLLILSLSLPLQCICAQSRETSESLKIADEEMGRLEPLTQESELVDSGAEGEKIQFHLVSPLPTKSTYYVKENDKYLAITASYNTFGPKHSLSKRDNLTLYTMDIIEKNNLENKVYLPAFSVWLGGTSQSFAAIMPCDSEKNRGTPEKPQPLQLIDLSTDKLPYNKLIFRNTLNIPLVVKTNSNSALLQPGSTVESNTQMYSQALGYVHIQLGFSNKEKKDKIAYRSDVFIHKGARALAIPIADPMGTGGVSIIALRYNPSTR